MIELLLNRLNLIYGEQKIMNNKLGVNDFRIEDLRIMVSDDTSYDIKVDFVGSFYSSYLEEFMDDYLNKLHQSLVRNGLKSVKLNFDKLTHIDSRGLSIIISWFKKIKAEDESNRYTVSIYYNDDLMVHQTSFEMVKELFPNIIEIRSGDNG
jgi:ABC-type transporter Mla MlaB component